MNGNTPQVLESTSLSGTFDPDAQVRQRTTSGTDVVMLVPRHFLDLQGLSAMHKIVRLATGGAAGLALALGGMVVATSPAAAAQDTPGCVTKKEYRKVHKGMTKKRVHRIFDTHRHWLVDNGDGRYTYTYQSCDFQHAAWIEYKRRPGKPDRTTGWKDWTGAS